jgi:RNA polymerase sigma-70 factor, ECF subfamily
MVDETRSQADLVRRAATRDADAFADLLDPLGMRLLLLIRRRAGGLTGPDCAPEDLLQTALTRVWTLLPTLDYLGPHAFYRWVATIAEHTVSDRLKYLEAKGRRDVRHAESDPVWAAGGVAAATTTSVASRAAPRKKRERLGDAIARLDAELRAVVEHRLLSGTSLAETASTLGISKTTAWNRLQEALAVLRVELEPEA